MMEFWGSGSITRKIGEKDGAVTIQERTNNKDDAIEEDAAMGVRESSGEVYRLLTLAWVIVPNRRVGAFIVDGEESSAMKEVKTDYGHAPLYAVDLVYSGFFPSKLSVNYIFSNIHTQYGTYSTDMRDIANGYLETILDWIPGMKNIRLRDFPSFIQSRDIDDTMLNYMIRETAAIPRGSAIVLNTFDALEHDSVNALIVTNPRIFTIGPLDMMQQHICNERVKQIGSNLWKEI
ncbi:hypothetical protein Tco_1491002 [Tanacetum coccineum]